MGFLQTLFGVEKRTYSASDDFWYTAVQALQPTAAGVTVDSESAMRSSAVAACVRVLSESVASLPLHVYKRLEDGGKERAPEHPLYDLLHNEPNDFMSAYQWVETAMVHLTLTGNHYSEKFLSGRGQVGALMPLLPANVTVERTDSGSVQYKHREANGTYRIIPRDRMLHIPGLGFDGLTGLSPIGYARESIGMALAGEEFGGRFYGAGLNAGSVVNLPEGVRWDDEQTEKFMDDLREKYAGLGKSHNAIALPAGMTVTPVGISPEDAQYIEGRRFQVEEIARIYRVPLHMVQSTTSSTTWGSGIEAMSLGFVKYTLRPWLSRIQQALDRSLMSPADRKTHFVEFLIADLLRGDQAAAASYYTLAITNGWMSRNEVRIIENMNPIEGGDEYLVPLNMGAAGDTGWNGNQDGGGDDDNERSAAPYVETHTTPMPVDRRANARTRHSIQRSYVRVFEDALTRVLRRERNDVLAAAKSLAGKRSVATLGDWLVEFYDKHAEFTSEQLRPAMTALAEAIGSEAMREIGREWEFNNDLEGWLVSYVEKFGRRYSGLQLAELLRLLDDSIESEADVVDAFTARFGEWEDPEQAARAATRARHETVQLGGGFARMAWTVAGVTTLVWVAAGSDVCPYCQAMDGRVVGIERAFVDEGGSVIDMTPTHSIGHPPLHSGCDCMIVPGS